ncbi:MAG: hypothetical protein LBG15_04935 [Dysgonamonadaceae bacterium]|jgi:uncharacterized protein (TIGR02145 family)|nr:hypothetical protein [Dysgonamonadaceae bacterium]
MKTTRTKQFLFLAAFCCMAASVAAQTVDVTLQCGQSYTINNTAPATDAIGLTYRWLENGSTVTGSVVNYTVPATKSVGIYTYIRQANSEGCADWQSSNAFTVEVKNKEGIDGVCLGGVMWAKYNVNEPGNFAASPGELGMLYKWDSLRYWPVNGPFTGWNDTPSPNQSWSSETNPCPPSWRVPTSKEWTNLVNATPRNATLDECGKSVIAAPENWNVAGRWLGPDARMANAIDQARALFLPRGSDTQLADDRWALSTTYWADAARAMPLINNYSLLWKAGCEPGAWHATNLSLVRCVHD